MTAINLMKEDNQFIYTDSADYSFCIGEIEKSISISDQKRRSFRRLIKWMKNKYVVWSIRQFLVLKFIMNLSYLP